MKSTHEVDGPSLWRLTLDQDLLDTLTRRFPSWFDNLSSTAGDSFQTSAEKYFTVNLADINGMAEGDSLGNSSAPTGQPLLSVDDSSNNTALTNSMTSRQSPLISFWSYADVRNT